MSESIIQSLSASVLRLGNEVRDLSKERDALKEHIRYLEIELTTETARWERAMQEYERLRASSFVTAVPVEEYEKLKAEVERLRKAGDRMAAALNGEYNYELPCVEDWNAAKDGKPTE